MVAMQDKGLELDIYEVITGKRKHEEKIEVIDRNQSFADMAFEDYAVIAKRNGFYNAQHEVSTIHCTCGFVESTRVSSKWSPQISEEIKAIAKEENPYKLTGKIRELTVAIKEVIKEHSPTCNNKELQRSAYKDYINKKKKTTTKFHSYIILDRFDDKLLRLRRYEAQYYFLGYDVTFEVVPKFQVYIGENGFENLLLARRNKGIDKFSEAETTFENINIAMSKVMPYENFRMSKEAENHPVWNRTGLQEFYEKITNSYNNVDSLWYYSLTQKIVKYIHQFHLYPSIEKIWKAGLHAYACDVIDKHTEIKDSIQEELLLPKPIIKHIKKLDTLSIKCIQKLNEKGGMTEEEAQIVIGQTIRAHTLEQMVNLTEMGNYTCRELFQYADRAWHSQALESVRVFQQLHDYVNMNIMMNAAFERFPKSLIREHDVTARDFMFVKDEVLNEKYEKTRKLYVENEFGYENKEFLIRAPRNLEEIAIEGNALNHCVASYAERVAQGTTTILMVRKKEEKETPWVTLEVSNSKTMVQARGKHNANYTDVGGSSLKSFIEEWKKLKQVS